MSSTTLNSITNRNALFTYLDDHMSKTYDKIKTEGELEYEQNILKTYIIETNIPVIDLPKIYGKNKTKIDIKKTEDKTLFRLDFDKSKEIKATFFLDSFNSRFWILHTVGNVHSTDYLMMNLVSPVMSHLDHPWLDKKFLGAIKLENSDYTRGIGIQYKYGQVFPQDDEIGETFTMRAWGSESDNILNQLEKVDALNHMLSLTSVGFKKNFEENDLRHGTIIEDINYQSKFTVKGTSIHEHLQTINFVREKYENKLNLIEDEFNLFYEKHDKTIELSGGPIVIEFKREIEDLKKFLDVVVSAKNPFRLAGFSQLIRKDLALVAGIDLHNGDKIDLEVTPYWIRIYLKKGSCGNTVLRFLSNLQRYFDANATLDGGEYGRID